MGVVANGREIWFALTHLDYLTERKNVEGVLKLYQKVKKIMGKFELEPKADGWMKFDQMLESF